jgi:hypothetical protein
VRGAVKNPVVPKFGWDGGLRRPRRVQRRNDHVKRSNIPFRPLNADGDAAARRLYPAKLGHCPKTRLTRRCFDLVLNVLRGRR